MIYSSPKNVDEARQLIQDLETTTKKSYAAKAGVNERAVYSWQSKAKRMLDEMPDTHFVKGQSIYYDKDGKVRGQWVKTDTDKELQAQMLKDAFAGFKDKIPKAGRQAPPIEIEEDLLSLYVITDLHVGMRSDEWNISLAEQVATGFIDRAMAQSPNSHTGVLVFQGDIAHFDSVLPVTPTHGHVLDADCSARTMNRIIIKIIRYAVAALLSKHEHVHVIFCAGNHDLYTAVLQSEWLQVHYEDEPRVTVDANNSTYHVYEWGLTGLWFHHGHKRNLSDIAAVFAGMYPEVFGRTKYRFGHIGHYHHSASKENQLMKVEIHQTLSGKDDHAIQGGWLSQRGANAITYHREYGEVSRVTIRPEMVI